MIWKFISLFCGLGGPYIAPFFAHVFWLVAVPIIPLFLLAWSILLVSSFTPLIYAPLNPLNSSDNEKLDYGRAFGVSLAIYYVIGIFVLCSVLQSGCATYQSFGM